MPPGRKERGRHSLSFLNRSDHFSHSLLWGPGLVRFLLLSTQFSVFVRDHLRRKGIKFFFFGGAAVKGRFPLFHWSREGGDWSFLNQALLTRYKLHCGWKEVPVSGATKGSSSSRNPLNRDWIGQASCLFILFYPVVRRDVKSTKYMCVHSVPGTLFCLKHFLTQC